MKLQRILAKDSRSANEQAIAQYGRDVLIVSNSRVNGMTELIVAVDVEPEKMPPPQMKRGIGEPFEQALRQQLEQPQTLAAKPSPMATAGHQPPSDALAPEDFVPAQMALMQAAQRAAAQSLGQTEPLRAPSEVAAPLPVLTAASPALDVPAAVRTNPAPNPAPKAAPGATPLQYTHQFSLGTAVKQSVTSFALPALKPIPVTPPSVQNPIAQPVATPDAEPEVARVISSDKAHALTDLIRAEIAQLRKEMRMGQQLQAWAAQGPSHRWNEALADVGVPTALRALLMSGLSNDWDDEQALAAIEAQMTENLPKASTSTRGGRGRRAAGQAWSTGVHLLSGPCGSGKTSMAARLAHEAAQRLGVDHVVLISWNDNRPGAWGQLQLWASRIGVAAFRAADSGTLDLLLQENRGSLVIIDSGLNQPDILNAAVQGLNANLHLVMPADANAATLRRWVGEQAPAWTDVLITRLDESAQPWPLLQACCEHQLAPIMASDGSGLQHLRQPYDAQALLQHGMAVLAAVLGSPAGDHGGVPAQAAGVRLEIPTIDHITTTVPPRQAGRSGRSRKGAPHA